MSLLDHAFESKSIAVIGASADERKEKTGWVGRLQEFGYPGKIYPINPGATMILGSTAPGHPDGRGSLPRRTCPAARSADLPGIAL